MRIRLTNKNEMYTRNHDVMSRTLLNLSKINQNNSIENIARHNNDNIIRSMS